MAAVKFRAMLDAKNMAMTNKPSDAAAAETCILFFAALVLLSRPVSQSRMTIT